MPKIALSGSARDRLAWLDHLAYELFRFTKRSQRIQCIWIYNREVDSAALLATTERLAALSFNRLIEPSALPGGRPRWVKPGNRPVPLEIGTGVLPRSQRLTWANQHGRAPIDPVGGPAWRMALQRFDDGSAAVSLVGAHLVIDGMGALRAIEAAANGVAVPSPYMAAGTRGWLAGRLSDARQSVVDAPQVVMALGKIALQALCTMQPAWSRPASPAPGADLLTQVDLPAVTVTVDAALWDACAQRLGGPANALLPAFVAAFAAQFGRRRKSDGAVTLLVPIDRRHGLDDTRALAIDFRTLVIAPDGVAQDLRPVKHQLLTLLRSAKAKTGDPLAALLPAISWMPRTIVATIVDKLFAYADDLPVSCSNLGRLPDGLMSIDGAPCGHVLTRAVDVNVTRQDLQRSHGHLVVVAARSDRSISLCIEACHLEPNLTTTDHLRQVVEQTLADFALQAEVEV
jgi:hypothetical protein